MLAAADMERSDVYITNVVKYRPPNNRDPLPEEKAAFLPYLLRQLEIINPKAIITLGRHSMEYFLPDARISQVHGHAVRKKVIYHDKTEHEWLIIPLYHPRVWQKIFHAMTPQSNDRLRINNLKLTQQVRQKRRLFFRQWVTVIRRTILDDIGDIDITALHISCS
jgi:uracil-DNA glycosylase family 4